LTKYPSIEDNKQGYFIIRFTPYNSFSQHVFGRTRR